MCIPQLGWTEVILPRPARALCSGRGGETKVAYIRCINSREPESYELWALVEEVIHKVYPSARVEISDNFTEDTFSMHDKSEFFSGVVEP